MNKKLSILCGIILVSSINMTGLAQNTTVTLVEKQSSIQTVLSKIEKQTKYLFVYDKTEIDVARKVSLEVNNEPVTKVLDKLFDGTNVSYNLNGNNIMLQLKKPDKQRKKMMKGIVTDSRGEPIIGAGVVIKGTTTGTVTQNDGTFALDGEEGETSLVVTCLSYKPKDVVSNGNSLIKVILEEDATVLDEVVVVGFGTQKRENLTGAVATIDAKELNNRPVVSAANALQGLDPSVNLTLGTGSPESSYSIDIRGSISINSGSPLILVDGIESDLRSVNPNDIESVSVLKDASASAIYGAKASAGVILVTTKQGKTENGKAKVKYSGRFGIADNTTTTDFITTGYDYVVLANSFYNSLMGNDFYLYPEANGELQKLLDRRNDATENPARPWIEVGSDGGYYYYANFDWFGYLYNRTRTQQEHNLSVNGGSDKFDYYFSLRHLDQEGIFKIYGDTYRDFSFRSKIGVRLFPKIKYSNNMSFDNTRMSYPGKPEYEQTIASMQSQLSPSFLPLNPDGSIVSYTNQTRSSLMGVGMLGSMSANNTWNSKIVKTLTLNNQIDWDIMKSVTLTAAYGIKMREPVNKYRNNTYDYSKAIDVFGTYTSGSVENAYSENYYFQTQQNIDLYATYAHNFGNSGNHHFKWVLGSQYIDYLYNTLQASQTDLSNQNLASFSVANGVITLDQKINTLRTLGIFSRLNYDYKGKYLMELSSRADGSSRFAKGSRWGFFPSGSLGWRVSDEPFFSSLKSFCNNFKVRASVGSLGNQQVSGYYTYIDQISSDNAMNMTFDDTSNAYYATVTAPIASNLTWETVTTYNVGADISFLKGRLSFNSDFYIRDTKNMLTSSMTLPDVYGASSPKTNNANLRTKGYELSLRWNDQSKLLGRQFSYGVTATLGDYLTKITKFNNPSKLLSDYYEGKTLGEIWGYHIDGLFASDEEAAAYQASIDWNGSDDIYNKIFSAKGVGMSKLLAGDMKFADLNGDGVISKGANTADKSGDRTVIGNILPRYSYSFRLDFSWNRMDISAFFQGVGKRNWYPAISSSTGQMAFDFFGPYAFPMTSFISKDFVGKCWSEDNKDAYFPRQRGYIARADGPLGQVNDRYLQNVGYLRLKNLSVGYSIPLGKMNKYVDKLRLSVNGENLWYWSPLKKYCKTVDPELALSSSTYNANSGVGYFYSRVVSFNVELSF